MRVRVKIPLTVKPKYLVLISVTLAVILLIVTLFDITEGRKDIIRAKKDEASSLLRTVQRSAENAYISSQEVEDLIKEKLVNTAYFVVQKELKERLDQNKLESIAIDAGVEHIMFFSPGAVPEVSNNNISFIIREYIKDGLDSINSGAYDYFVAGLILDEEGNEHYSVLQKRYSPHKGFLLTAISSDKLLEFRKKIGIGRLLQNIAGTEEIVYLVIQDSTGILAASSGVKELSSVEGDPFIAASVKNNKLYSREINFNSEKIFEAVEPFTVNGEAIGVVRIGLSLRQAESMINRTIIRSVVISSLLLLTGVIILIIITDSQNIAFIKDENRRIQTYTGNILNNMSEGVLAADNSGKITLLNPAAEKILGLSPGEGMGKYCSEVIRNSECIIETAIKENTSVEYKETSIITGNGHSVIIGGTADIVRNEDMSINTVVAVIRDVSLQKSVIDAQKRNEKLSAMGELAAGVAHEIKNPLNAIGITAQRLEREFEPAENREEFHEMMRTMKSEVERVSNIINQFLNFARPRKIQTVNISSADLLKDVYNMFYSRSVKDNIKFELNSVNAGIKADSMLLKQALINIIQNAFEAVSPGGKIFVNSYTEGENLVISIKDDGPGIEEENIGRIFNLYFTTKPSGSGMGLGIVNQVITEHNGSIKINSAPGRGTEFVLFIPLSGE